MELTQNQINIFELAVTGHNLFITGGGGVGKSVLINHIMQSVMGDSTVVFAPTGIAALNVGGMTLHSGFGLPFGIPTEKETKRISNKCRNLFSGDVIKTIIIDEISMVRADVLSTVDAKLRRIKRTKKPFGGLQVIVVGDFFQLPPVLKEGTEEADIFYSQYRGTFCFWADVWKSANFIMCELNEVMRQSDTDFIDTLNAIRKGENIEDAIDHLNSEAVGREFNDFAITLCTTNAIANDINRSQYRKIKGEEEHQYFGKFSKTFGHEKPVSEIIELKRGCRVVICANDRNEEYKNGQTGIVFSMGHDYVDVELDCSKSIVRVMSHKWEKIEYKVNYDADKGTKSLEKDVVGSFSQIPLKLGYAISIHRSQGMSLDKAIIDMGWGAFSAGQTYVALSRIRTLEGMSLTKELVEDDVITDKSVLSFYRYFRKVNNSIALL